MTKTSSNLVVGTTLLLVVGAVAGHFFGESVLKLIVPVAEGPQVEQQVLAPLGGTLLMTMRSAGEDNARSAVYRVPLGGGDSTLEDASNDFFAPSLSHDGSRVAIVGNTEDSLAQLFIAQLTSTEVADVIAPPAPALYAGASSWSSDDAYLAYAAVAAAPTEDNFEIAYSYVVLLSTQTHEQVILDQGTSPVFAEDGSIFYVKHDGIYRVTVDELTMVGEPERVLYFDGYNATRYARIALSPDNTRLVLTNPSESTMATYTINNADGVITLEENSRMERSAFWPVFSGDGTHLAYIAVDPSGGTTRILVVAIDMATGEERIVKDVSGFDESSLSLTGWLN